MENKIILELLEGVQQNPDAARGIKENPKETIKQLLPNASDDDIGEVITELNDLPEGTDISRLNLGGINISSLLGLLLGGNNNQSSGLGLGSILSLLSLFTGANKPQQSTGGLGSLLGMGAQPQQNTGLGSLFGMGTQQQAPSGGVGDLLSLLAGGNQPQQNINTNQNVNINELLGLLNANKPQPQTNQSVNLGDLLSVLNGNQPQNNQTITQLSNNSSTKPKPSGLGGSIVNSLADRDGDGDVDINDIANIASNFLKK